MAYYVALHPQLTDVLSTLCDGRESNEPMFAFVSFYKWAREQKISLSRCKGYVILSDLRKFAEQWGDIVQWDQSNRAYILTRGLSGIEWAHCRHPLPERVYEAYTLLGRDATDT
jgi:hypothetical protein